MKDKCKNCLDREWGTKTTNMLFNQIIDNIRLKMNKPLLNKKVAFTSILRYPPEQREAMEKFFKANPDIKFYRPKRLGERNISIWWLWLIAVVWVGIIIYLIINW